MSDTERVDADGVYVYTGKSDSEIPRDVRRIKAGPSVRAIAAESFRDRSTIEEAEFCEGLEEIGERAFANCASLRRVQIPSSVRAVHRMAFQGCEGLERVGLAEGLESIGPGAFRRCHSLKSVRIPSTVKIFHPGAFADCENLAHVELRPGLECIGDSAFAGCKSLKFVNVPPSVTLIDKMAFSGCSRLEGVQLGEGIECIKTHTFIRCKSLKRIAIPSSVKVIGLEAFRECNQLAEVNLSDGVKRLREGAFACCKALKFVDLSAVKDIGRDAFLRCYQLGRVELGEGLEHVGEGAFGHCKALRCTKVPGSARVEHRAFLGCRHLMSAELFCGQTNAEKSAFHNCASLRNVAHPPKSLRPGRFGEGCHDLLRLFGSRGKVVDALNTRFHGLPAHGHCYCQSLFRSSEVTIKRITQALDQRPNKNGILQNTSNNSQCAQDCVGMTPLHILACSSTHRLDLYDFIVAKYPKSLITDDKWGCIPILYAIWGGAPKEIIQFLVDRQKSAFPNFTLKWDEMIKTLCRAGAPVDTVQRLFDIRLGSFPEQGINVEAAARELTILCVIKCDSLGDFSTHWNSAVRAFCASEAHQALVRSLLGIERAYFPDHEMSNWKTFLEGFVAPLQGWWYFMNAHFVLRTFEFLVKCDVSGRLGNIGVREWRRDIQSSLHLLRSRPRNTGAVPCDILHTKLISYEEEYRRLKDVAFLLELALWRSKVKEREQKIGKCPDNEEEFCRVHCGAAVAIPNIIPFLFNV